MKLFLRLLNFMINHKAFHCFIFKALKNLISYNTKIHPVKKHHIQKVKVITKNFFKKER